MGRFWPLKSPTPSSDIGCEDLYNGVTQVDCSRCDAKAVVRRGEAVYCGKCAMARDWEEVIQFIQTERVGMKSAPKSADTAPAPAAADRPGGQDEMKTRPARKPEPAPQAEAATPERAAAEPAAPPADPFA